MNDEEVPVADHESITIAAILADALCLATSTLGPANEVYKLACTVRDRLGGNGYAESVEVYKFAQKIGGYVDG